MTPPSRPYTSSMPPIAVRWQPPRILSEHLGPLPEPLACLLAPGPIDTPAAVAALGARALLDLAPLGSEGRAPWPAWLAPHQVPAAERLRALLARYGGALLADAPGLGKSYVALAVAFAVRQPFALVVPAVLVDQWRALLARFDTNAPMITHESLSATPRRPLPPAAALCRLFLVDEAHRFRNPDTNRYRALARLVVGARVLLVTATPVHNRVGDLCHLLRLFLRDHELTALGVPSLSRAARGDAATDLTALTAAAARLCVSRSRERARTGWSAGAVTLSFPAGQEDLQLALFPVLLPAGKSDVSETDGDTVRRLSELAGPGPDPKADALERMLVARGGKTIVFVQPRATVQHLFRRLRGHRVAAVMGDRGWFGRERATRAAVLRAFAPLAQGAPAPAAAMQTDILLATDLLSEGLNLQDAVRVIHYDVPWSPARMAQRVGRIDRAGSPHAYIETMTFLPPPSLADALAIERRWLAKARAQAQTGAAQIELADGGTAAAVDWCDRLQQLAGHAERPAAPRRAAARRRQSELARLDALVSRLALGMTAGEEVLLDELLGRRAPLTVRDVLAWHERLPRPAGVSDPPAVRLEAALVLG